MAKRATRNASLLFQKVLSEAEERLALSSQQASNYEHRSLRGNERAGALADFLSLHLPNVFAVGRGEARDYRDNATGELDLFVYDRSTAAPIQTGVESLIVPAEALYAVIEVKSVLSKDELERALRRHPKLGCLCHSKSNSLPLQQRGRRKEPL